MQVVHTCGRGLSVFGGGKFGFAGAAMLPDVAFVEDFALASGPLASCCATTKSPAIDENSFNLPDPCAATMEVWDFPSSGELISTVIASSAMSGSWKKLVVMRTTQAAHAPVLSYGPKEEILEDLVKIGRLETTSQYTRAVTCHQSRDLFLLLDRLSWGRYKDPRSRL